MKFLQTIDEWEINSYSIALVKPTSMFHAGSLKGLFGIFHVHTIVQVDLMYFSFLQIGLAIMIPDCKHFFFEFSQCWCVAGCAACCQY